jgi:large subunit ribosomal protein L22
MQAKAIHRHVGTSPRKMRLVIDLIRGKNVEQAKTLLEFNPKHASHTALKVLKSAVSNYMNTNAARRVEESSLFVKTAFVDQGKTIRRMLPAPMGRAYRMRKRSNHITIIVDEKRIVTATKKEETKTTK